MSDLRRSSVDGVNVREYQDCLATLIDDLSSLINEPPTRSLWILSPLFDGHDRVDGVPDEYRLDEADSVVAVAEGDRVVTADVSG